MDNLSDSILTTDMSAETNHCTNSETEHDNAMHIDLWVRDSEVITALSSYSEGRDRDKFTCSALRIGILALQQAEGRIDGETIRNEGEKLIMILESKLGAYENQVSTILTDTMTNYFDPQSGRFNERIERLIKKDGEIEKVIRTQVDASATTLKQTLDAYIGQGSEFAKLLTPDESNKLLTAIRSNVEQLISTHKQQITSEFSLDNKEGALTHLLEELNANNGILTGDLKTSVQKVVDEFSLNNEDSALSRLVKRVEKTQQMISAEFTLDDEKSALSRMKRDLLEVVESQRKGNIEFQNNVMSTLEAMKARKKESYASTQHGNDFELCAYEYIEGICQDAGDIPEHTGNRPGKIKHCKVGDCVITLGPDSNESGARIVTEMKEDGSYSLTRSLSDINEARKNRDAAIGLFIHSKRTAPDGLKPLARYGNDVVVVWDSEDAGSDVFLTAAIMICKALAIRIGDSNDEWDVDIQVIEKSIREIERQADFLNEIKKNSSTIKNGAEKILKRVNLMSHVLGKEIDVLDSQVVLVKKLFG